MFINCPIPWVNPDVITSLIVELYLLLCLFFSLVFLKVLVYSPILLESSRVDQVDIAFLVRLHACRIFMCKTLS